MKKYKQVNRLDDIQVGFVTLFNDKRYNRSKVLKIFPEGNDATTKSCPYYVERDNGALTYVSRDMIKESNIKGNLITEQDLAKGEEAIENLACVLRITEKEVVLILREGIEGVSRISNMGASLSNLNAEFLAEMEATFDCY